MARGGRMLLAILLAFCASGVAAQERPSDPLAAARKARDDADSRALQAEIQRHEQELQKRFSLENWLRAAQLLDWLCEAARLSKDEKTLKRAAQAGVDAAERAVALDAKSSEAHRWLGHHLGNLIAVTFMGGMRFGSRSTKELDLALQLDAKNAEAQVSRALAYYFAPGMFGGSKTEAERLLNRALELEPRNENARIWLALVYNATKRKEEALREIREARRINPARKYAQDVEDTISGKSKSATAGQRR